MDLFPLLLVCIVCVYMCGIELQCNLSTKIAYSLQLIEIGQKPFLTYGIFWRSGGGDVSWSMRFQPSTQIISGGGVCVCVFFRHIVMIHSIEIRLKQQNRTLDE